MVLPVEGMRAEMKRTRGYSLSLAHVFSCAARRRKSLSQALCVRCVQEKSRKNGVEAEE